MYIEKLKADMQFHLSAAKGIADRVEKEQRDFTPEERQKVEEHLGEIKRIERKIEDSDPEAKRREQKERDKNIYDQIMKVEKGSGLVDSTHSNRSGGKAGGPWSKAFMAGLPYQPGSGRKDLLPPSGSITVGRLSPNIGTIDDEGKVETILQIIPTTPDGGDAFSYLRETVRSHQARPVAIGEKKPTSVYTLERVDDRIRTIAHLSEPISRNWLSDAPMLRNYIDMTLRSGVIQELEYQILQGTGLVEDLPGILNAANTLLQGFDTNILVTCRKAVTFLELRPVMPSAFVFNPEDWETVELATASGSGEFLVESSPVDRGRRRLWGLPVALTLGVPAGTGILADWRTAVTLHEREAVRVDWSEAFTVDAAGYDEDNATGFQTNEVQFRGEGRWGLEINRPGAICIIDLTLGS